MGKARSSIGLWAFIWGAYKDAPVPQELAVETVAGLGFDGVEVAAYEPYFHHNSSRNRRMLRKLFDDNGLDRSGLLAPLPSAVRSSSLEYVDAIRGALDICVDVDVPMLRVDTGETPEDLPDGMSCEEAFERAAENWQAAAEECARAGVKLAWEFDPGFLFNKPSEILAMVENVNHPNFRLLFDTCHAHLCSAVGARQTGCRDVLSGGVEEFIGMCAGKIGHIHLIDSDGTLRDGETSNHVPFGRGVLDFDRLMPAFNKAGSEDDWWVVDLAYWPGALDVTGGTKKYLDGLMDKYGR